MEGFERKKRLIYIAPETNPIIERVCKEEMHIDIVQRFINEYNFQELSKSSLQSLNGIDIIIIDVRAISNSTNDKEILDVIHTLKTLYDCRIIFIAQGYQKGSTLLGGLFAKGVLNIITANSDVGFEDELKKTLSEKGMSFAAASKYEIDNFSNIISNSPQNIVKQNYIKIRQDISVGVIGICNHIGTTTFGINILSFLNSLTNIRACLIENNNHNDIRDIYERNEDEDNVNLLEDIGKVEFQGLDFYYKPENIGDIRKENYDFYIYDFGTIDELNENDIASFLNKDIKILVMSNKYWEDKKVFSCFKKLKLNPDDETVYYIFNFVADNKRDEVLNSYKQFKTNIYFTDYQPDPFVLCNKPFFEKVFSKFFENYEFKEEEKKSIFPWKKNNKRGGKQNG